MALKKIILHVKKVKKALVLVGEGAFEQRIKGQIVFDFLIQFGAICGITGLQNN